MTAAQETCVICGSRAGDLYRVRYGFVQTYTGQNRTVYGSNTVYVRHQATVGVLSEYICRACIPEWKPVSGWRWKSIVMGFAMITPLFFFSYAQDAWGLELPVWLSLVIVIVGALGVGLISFGVFGPSEKKPNPDEHRRTRGKGMVWARHSKQLNARYSHAVQTWRLEGDQVPNIAGTATRAINDTVLEGEFTHFNLRNYRDVTLATTFGPLKEGAEALPEKRLVSPRGFWTGPIT